MSGLEMWARYARWNRSVAVEFFGGRYGGSPVYIDLEDDALDRIAREAGFDDSRNAADGLIAAVKPTLNLATRGGVFGAHIRRLRRWARDGGETPPPVIAVLALQSMVAERMRRGEDLSSSNYYGRFLQTVGVSAADVSARAKLMRAFGDESYEMWTALNLWLGLDPDVRGLPTAYSFDRRVRIGIPISQALVRDGDRQAIRALFAELSLVAGQTVSVEDMTRLLRDWLPDSNASTGLKRLVRDDEALARVAAVATIELAAWSGEIESGQQGQPRSAIGLTAQLRRLPRRALRLGAAIRLPAAVDLLGTTGDADEAGRLAFPEPVMLAAGEPGSWRPVVSVVNTADLLVGRVRLIGDEACASRDPRTVVVLAQDNEAGGYREVDRIRMRAPHLILAVEPARGRVASELGLIARDGWLEHDRLHGLPDGWVLFEGVEIVAISDTRAPDLAALIPLVWTELGVADGYRLPGRATWHSSAAPEIRASAPPGRALILTIAAERDLAGQSPSPDDELSKSLGPNEPIHVSVFEDSETVEFGSFELDDGDYRASLRDAHNQESVLSTTLIHLRSSETPTELEPATQLVEDPRAPLGAITARATQRADELWVTGVQAAVLLDPHDDESRVLEPDADEDDPIAAPRQASTVPECFVHGAHHFVLESSPHGGRWDAAFDGVCKYCEMEKRFPARPRRRRGRAKRLGPAASAPAARPASSERLVDHDLIFDALCQQRSGSAATLRRLVSQLDDQPWAAVETARRLVSLGHLKVELNSHLQLARWSVAPPQLVAAGPGAFLAGWRSPSLAHQLGQAVRRHNGRLLWTAQVDGPARIAVSDVEPERLEALAAELSDRSGLAVRLGRGALDGVDALPDLAELRSQLPILGSLASDAPLQRLDPDAQRWVPASAMRLPGAYRALGPARVYLHFDGRDMRRADSRLAKWLDRPCPMLSFDERASTVCCQLGGEPPGLYERALVLSSGLLPERCDRRFARYGEVSASIASALVSRLQPTPVLSS